MLTIKMKVMETLKKIVWDHSWMKIFLTMIKTTIDLITTVLLDLCINATSSVQKEAPSS